MDIPEIQSGKCNKTQVDYYNCEYTHTHTLKKRKKKKAGCEIQAEKDLTVQTAAGILHVLNLAHFSLGSNV